MVDIKGMIKSLHLAWLKRIFGDNSGALKNCLEYLLKETGGLVLFNFNYSLFSCDVIIFLNNKEAILLKF